MEFERVQQAKFKRKSSIIADQLLNLIKKGIFTAGSKLPAERILAEKMGVGRPSVREAISALQIVGILESRPGDGSYVAGPGGFDDLMVRALDVLEESDSPFEVLQVRKAMEIGIIHLAIKMATEEDVQAIRAAWKLKYEKGRSKKYREFISCGHDFHLAIAKATKSKAIESVMDGLLKLTSSQLWLSMREGYFNEDPERIEPILELHENIVRAIEERNSEWAIQLMEDHFDLNLKQQYDVTDGANDN